MVDVSLDAAAATLEIQRECRISSFVASLEKIDDKNTKK
jgi:hypothetical protein